MKTGLEVPVPPDASLRTAVSRRVPRDIAQRGGAIDPSRVARALPKPPEADVPQLQSVLDSSSPGGGSQSSAPGRQSGESSRSSVPAVSLSVVADPTAVLQQHGKSFYFASKLLSNEVAARCARLYRFCRYVDDIADSAATRVHAVTALDAIEDMLRSGAASDPVVADFIDLAESCGMSVRPALELVVGVRSDLSTVRMRDERELHRYCYRVAGTVGLLMCGVLGVSDPRAYPFAIDLGVAMQLTNIARDVAEDARDDRRYLPATIIGDVPPAAIADPDPELRMRLASAVRWLLDESERYYRSGERGLVFLPDRARLAIRVAARVYRRIGILLRYRGCATWQGRAVVPTWQKCGVAAAATVAEIASRAEKSGLKHDRILHRSLVGLAGADTWAGRTLP